MVQSGLSFVGFDGIGGNSHMLANSFFGLFAAVAWWLMDMLGGQSNRATERLDELRNPGARRRDEAGKGRGKGDAMSKMLEMASPALSRPLQPKTELEAGKLKARLAVAGFRSDSAASAFLGLKFIGLCAGFLIGGGALLITSGATQKSMMYTVFVAGVTFYIPDLIVAILARRRKTAIFLSLPDALDLLVVCVEAGLGLDQALRKVSEEMKDTAPVIASEFNLSNFQFQMGRPRNEVLRELGARTGVDDLRALAAILIQADKFGSSVALALRVQSDAMRLKRRQLAEEKAAKTAVKLIFPLVIFIFPGIFVVLVGPAAITIVREMFPAMGAK
jgi:tight adherence protein C